VSGHRTARVLVYTHRWLGIAGGALFIVWFVSGMVMIYARMPVLDTAERLARLPAINPAFIRVPLTAVVDGDASRIALGSIEGRPIFRLTAQGRSRTVFADTGDEVPAVDADQSLRIARAFAGGYDAVRYDARLEDADQWTFAVRGRMPLHRIAVDDTSGTRLYVAENGGDVVMKTTASGRTWGWLGAVLHWWYFTPLRRNGPLWNGVIVWSSIAGTLLCLVGVLWGCWRISPLRGYRLRDHRQWSPYAGWMRWHHYAGLVFGVTTMMWVFSGLLSMDPWDWHPGTAPTRDQRQRVSGGALSVNDLPIENIRQAVAAFAPGLPKEIELVRFRGRYYASAASGIVSLDQPQFGVLDRLAPDLVVGAAGVAMPGVPIEGMQWMDEYDAYYYDRDGGLSLPVLRVRYSDPQRTWLYFDPKRGTIARKYERLSRVNRWLYHGFHSFDFPFLYYRRPLWDLVVIVSSLGGLLLSATTFSAGWRRVWRRTKGITAEAPAGSGTDSTASDPPR